MPVSTPAFPFPNSLADPDAPFSSAERRKIARDFTSASRGTPLGPANIILCTNIGPGGEPIGSLEVICSWAAFHAGFSSMQGTQDRIAEMDLDTIATSRLLDALHAARSERAEATHLTVEAVEAAGDRRYEA